MPSGIALQKNTDDIWALVAYIKSLPYQPDNLELSESGDNKPIR